MCTAGPIDDGFRSLNGPRGQLCLDEKRGRAVARCSFASTAAVRAGAAEMWHQAELVLQLRAAGTIQRSLSTHYYTEPFLPVIFKSEEL